MDLLWLGARVRVVRCGVLSRRVALLVVVLCLSACHSRAGAKAAPSQPPTLAPDAVAPAVHADASGPQAATAEPDAGPALPDRSAYAGEDACLDCHEDEVTALAKDWHGRALAKASATSVVANFHDQHFRGSSSEAWMTTAHGQFQMRTQGRDGALGTFPVDYVIGGKRMQDTVTVFPDGRWQILPTYFHVTGKGAWTDYTEAKQGALTPDHPYFWTNFRRTANRECLDCHATGVDVRYQPATHAWTTRMVTVGIGCESCHGPGARHAETQLASDIVRPSRLDPERQRAVCGQCHGPRDPLFPLLDGAHRFRPGDRYDDFYQALEWAQGRERSGDFFADGRPKSSSFEYQALVQSRCAMEGQATCLSCHTAPHRAHRPDELKLTQRPHGPTVSVDQASCGTCHAKELAEGRRHTHHASAQANRCTACHMPKIVSAVFDTFPDHSLDIPNPMNTERHGVANACAVCHAKTAPRALQAQMERFWPDVAQRQARRTRLADALDEATAAQSRPALLAVVADAKEAPLLRGAAAELLAQRFPREAASALAPLLGDPDALVRAKVADALQYTRDRSNDDALVRLTSDPSIWVRQASAVSLVQLGDRRGEAALAALAGDPRTEGLPTPHLALGLLAGRRHDFATAEAELQKAVALQPYLTEGLLGLSSLAERRGDLVRARALLEEVLRFVPDHAQAKARLARLTGLVEPRAPAPGPERPAPAPALH